MAVLKLQPLPLGTSTFSVLRQDNEIYVDKTDLIYMLASEGRGKIFLARPRRFGKSLLVSTFESLFSHGTRDFRGLAIEKLWRESKTYPVVHLDFSLLKGKPDSHAFAAAFEDMLFEAFSRLGFEYDDRRSSFFAQLAAWLEIQPGASLVLLIDEYDAPLTERLDAPEEFEAVRRTMSGFFDMMKSNEGCLRFFFMTGITKFRHTSIFSELNNLDDISLNPIFGSLLGYTEKEIEKYFSGYLQRASQLLTRPQAELMNAMRAQYDGFSFDERAASRVFNPWSVLNFLKYPQLGFKNYWYESGGQPTVLKKYLDAHGLLDPQAFNQPSAVDLDVLKSPNELGTLSPHALLTQTGYLTIRREIVPGIVELGYPNKEVSASMARLYADAMLKAENLLPSGIPFLPRLLAEKSLDAIVDAFNKAINALDYQRFPIRDEASCRASIQLLLIGAAMMPSAEVHSALGRSDLEVDAGRLRWVFEFKYAENEAHQEKLLSEALDQLKSRRYGEKLHGKELHCAALVFDARKRRFRLWRELC